MKYLLFMLIVGATINTTYAQSTALLQGTITNEKGEAIDLVNIAILGDAGGTSSDKKGEFKLIIPADTAVTVIFSHVLYQEVRLPFHLKAKEERQHQQILKQITSYLQEVRVFDMALKNANLERLENQDIEMVATATNAVEALIKVMPGVSSNNGMSNQYTVRGGNFDENLVYINGVEIYRPQLLVNGQEEGLSAINSDMVSSVLFSAGGFGANYGDKMASVLDVKYRKPDDFKLKLKGSLLGASGHLQGISKNKKFTHSTGIRYRNTQLLLGDLDTGGNYEPKALDGQTYLSWAVNSKWSLEFLGMANQSDYHLEPSFRETTIGMSNTDGSIRFKSYLKGQQDLSMKQLLATGVVKYQKNEKTQLRFSLTHFQSQEKINRNFYGNYNFIELSNDINTPTLGDSIGLFSHGVLLDVVDNELKMNTVQFVHHGTHQVGRHHLQWGARFENRKIKSSLQEFFLNDTTDIALTLADTTLFARESIQGQYHLLFNNLSVYLMDTYTFEMGEGQATVSGGVRATYSDFTRQLLFSPRFSLTILPNEQRNRIFRVAAGYYQQAPFYNELLNRTGKLVTDVKAQSSAHLILGSDFYFKIRKQPFKLTMEAYYKHFKNLNPYYFEDVRLHYYAKNNAHGYAYGLDTRLYGEFVNGIESWVTLSILKTEEDIMGDSHISSGGTQTVEAGYIPRPTDRRMNLSLMFQDELPRLPSFRVFVNMIFGTGLPFGNPKSERNKHVLRMGEYRNLDIGIAKVFKDKDINIDSKMFRHFERFVLSLELLNVWNVKNTVAHEWFNFSHVREIAVPYTTAGRRVNVRLSMDF